MPEYRLEPIESPPFSEISYVIWRPGRADALVIDPGFDPRSILDVLDREGLRPAAVLNTHGHLDHIAGNAALKTAFPESPLIIGRGDEHLLSDPEANMSAAFGQALRSPAADRLVGEGERLELAGFQLGVREVPGHSPGSVVYVLDEFDPPIVFGGDVLFAGSVGRTDFGGDFEQLRAGIRSKLFALPDAARVFPGHGPPTTIGRERQTNPFVGDGAGFVPSP